MDLELAGLRVLVTGSSGGVGAAIAERLALEGCRVIVHGRREGPAAEQAESIRRAGGQAEVLLGDLAVSGEPGRLAAAALDGGQVDVLIANAGPSSTESLRPPTRTGHRRSRATCSRRSAAPEL